MWKKIVLGVLAVVLVFLGYVSTREGKFHYETSGVIKATPEEIFPFISQLKLGGMWSPYEKIDPQMKKGFSGTDGQVGSVMEFKGNSEAGSGKIEVIKVVPNQNVEMKLTMTEPFFAENTIVYTLSAEPDGTRFTWAMHGDGGFMGKLMSALVDCEKMVTDQFKAGIENLKVLIETSQKTSGADLNLTEKPEIVNWEQTHFVFVEKIGPFMQTAQKAWEEMHAGMSSVVSSKRAPQTMSLYKISPQMIYRAGVVVDSPIKDLPEGFKYEKFSGGKYAKFTLVGSYSQLAMASGRIMKLTEELNLPLRDGFYIENYVNSPSEVSEDKLITEILVPIK